MKNIHILGARQNNLKNIEIQIPLESFTVVCGPSGSGKSSLAFETLYAEGQRRYIESLSNYSRQFLSKMPKPDIDFIDNIPPAISLEQKNSVKSSRSNVGTKTEIIDYLRLLFEKLGKALCPTHKVPLERDTPSSSASKVLNQFVGQRGYILAPVPQGERLANEKKMLDLFRQEGYQRLWIPSEGKGKSGKSKSAKSKSDQSKSKNSDEFVPEGTVVELSDVKLQKSGVPKKDFFLVIDRLSFDESDRGRLVDSLSQAFQASVRFSKAVTAQQAVVLTTDNKFLLFSEEYSCHQCGYKFPPISAALFSFNSPVGACEACNGFGNILSLDEQKIVPNPKLSLLQGALTPFAMPSANYDRRMLRAFCKKMSIPMDVPWEDLEAEQKQMLWKGNDDFYGIEGLFEYLETKKYKMHVRVFISRYKSPFICKTCKGSRLKAAAQQVLLNDRSIGQLSAMTIEKLSDFFDGIRLSPGERDIAAEPLRQLRERLKFLCLVGVGYLTVDRPTRTLSGGEFQRLNLVNQLGMGLSQTLYVLDEPTVGLHPRDNDRLIQVLKSLQQLGNTLVIVEHDHDVIQNAGYLIEMGPGSGHLGGEVIFSGSPEEFLKSKTSNTASYFRPSAQRALVNEARPVQIDAYKYTLNFNGCNGHNLKDIDVRIPLNRLVTVTGVSGSGKSTLVSQTIYPAVARALGVEFLPGQTYDTVEGLELVKAVVFIDQAAIGKTARSNPLTYLKIFDPIRTLFAACPDAKVAGYDAGTFSLNVDGGRCPVCRGLGYEVVDMMFMDDLEIKCEACDGKRYRPEILEIRYKGKNVHEILQMTVNEAMDFFVAYPNIRRPLAVLKEVGLDYIRLGQSANSFSGGESQRLKLARELSQSSQRGTLYILDEPTTGLHFREVHLLLRVLNRLIEAGGSVLLIEHNLEIIKNSDFVIDLGPEAGVGGGKIVAQGTPRELIKQGKGFTARYLKDYVEQARREPLTKAAT